MNRQIDQNWYILQDVNNTCEKLGIFNVDGGIMKALGKVTDIICLSLLFFVCSIPVFTMGTAGTALYYTVNKVIRNTLNQM